MTATPMIGSSWEPRRMVGPAGVALATIVTAMVVGIISLFAVPASATPLVGPQNAVGAFAHASGQRVGAHEEILPGESRQRAPAYDRTAVGSCVGAESAGEGTSVFRTPQLGNGESELEHGLNPANHLEGDQSAYVGTENVASDYANPKVGGYENGYIRFDMSGEFESEFSQYKFPYTTASGESGFEWQIPASQIGRFNDLTVGRTWVPWSS